MILRKILLTAIAATIAAASQAAEPTLANRQAASNYFAYPYPEQQLPKLTPAPKGYEPFHMEHYGRHGSRWHIGEWVYQSPVKLLLPAERNGKLTPRGQELLEQMRRLEIASRGRSGELTPLGAEQHRGIARRMTANFPEIFADGARVDAKSTDVVRCILSMENELMELMAFNPRLDITSDASKSTVRYLNPDDAHADSIHNSIYPQAMAEVNAANIPDYEAFALQLVNDPKFIADSINAKDLYNNLFLIVANAQSLTDRTAPFDLYTDRQIHDKWVRDNAEWFLRYGNTKWTGGTGPMRQRFLLRNWIESADTCIMRQQPSANLRFGHEVVLLPMAMLMNLDGTGRQIDDMTRVADQWKNYEIFPMASNIQMIFYRPQGQTYTPDDVLVKVLLNEKEVTLPAKVVSGPYYRWTDIRRTYLDLLGTDGGRFPSPKPLK